MEGKELSSFKSVDAAVWDKFGKHMEKPSNAKEWETWSDLLWECAVEVDTGEESSDLGNFQALLNEYLEDNKTRNREVDEHLITQRLPFLYEGATCIRLTHFQRYLDSHNARMNGPQITNALKLLGAERKEQRVVVGGDPVRFWKLP